MDSTTNNGMCRCCASEGTYKDVHSKYSWMGDEEIYSDMLKQCFDIDLCMSSDGDNGGICEVCITQLRNAANFKKQVVNTEEQFKKHLQEKLYKSNIVKVEVQRSDDIESDNNASDDYSAPEFDMPIKEEVQEVPKPKKRAAAAKATSSAAKKPKTETGETSTKRARGKVKKVEKSKAKTVKKTAGIDKRKTKEQTGDKKGVLLQKHRTNTLEILVNTNATPIRNHGDMGYECCYCQDAFQNAADLKNHSLTSHDGAAKTKFLSEKRMDNYLIKLDITGLECNLCAITMDTLEQLMNHLSNAHEKNIHTDIENRILPFKFDSEMLYCFMCSNVFHKFRTLQEHMGIHYRNYICDVCDAGFVTRQILRCHASAHKTGVFNCDKCPKVFSTPQKKKMHERAVHDHVLLHKCAYCNERFKEMWHKRDHLAKVHDVHGPAKICQACGKSFDSRQGLIFHINRHHLMLKPHKCDHCDMDFVSKSELNAHVIKHTGSKNFQCQFCFKLYARQKTLKEHMRRVHSCERKFKCVDCGESFEQKRNLNNHVLAKHGHTLIENN